jgi:hypothetical protein
MAWIRLSIFVAAIVLLPNSAPMICAADELSATAGAVHWKIDNLESIGGRRVTVIGSPKVIETERGKAVEFDGRGDALFVDVNPLAGLKQFTAEVVFRPAAGGPREQRFLHFQPTGTDDRLLFETRLPSEGQWFLDTYLQAGLAKQTLYAETFLHQVGPWYAAAIVVDGKTMRHYVNDQEELSARLPMGEALVAPLGAGATSIGVRFNKVHWFQGAIREIRITPGVLGPQSLLQP